MATAKPATVAEHVRQHLDGFTRSERKVAHALLVAYPIAGLETVAKFAARAETSGPTILRFIGRLGYHSYGAFQQALYRELQERLEGPLARYRQLPEDSADGDLFERMANSLCDNIRRSVATVPRGEMAKLVELLADEQRPVHLLGGRFSQMVAAYFHQYLREIRPRVQLVAGGADRWAEHLLDMGRRDVLVVFDFRRYQADVVALARSAAREGATIVLFTDFWNSPIASVARHVVPVPVQVPSAFDSGTAALAMVEVIVAGLVERLGRRARQRMSRLETIRGRQAAPTLDAKPGGREEQEA